MDKKSRLEEIESMLRDPQLTSSRKASLLAEKAALLSVADTAQTGANQSAEQDHAADRRPITWVEKMEAARKAKAEEAAETPPASSLAVLPSAPENRWKAGTAVLRENLTKALRFSFDTNLHNEGALTHFAPNTDKDRPVVGAMKELGALFGSLVLHAGVASAAGFVLGGPVGAIALPLANAFAMQVISTGLMAAVPAVGLAGIKTVDLGLAIKDKLMSRRAESSAMIEPIPTAIKPV